MSSLTDAVYSLAYSLPDATPKAARITHSGLVAATKDISDSIRDGSATIAKEIFPSAYEVSKSIFASSQNISLALNSISNEMERNNKQNEYYMLKRRIEEYEDYCIEHKIIKKVYEEMDLVEIPLIENLTVEQGCKLFCLLRLNSEVLSLIQNIVQTKLISPMEALVSLAHLGYSSKNYFISINGTDICIDCTDMAYKTLSEHKPNSSEVLNIFWKLADKSYCRYSYEHSLYQNEIITLVTRLIAVIDVCNREIGLTNLRNLYEGLEAGVRKYKLEAALVNN